MASRPDGSIVIDTEIKKDSAVQDVETLKGILKDLTATVKELTTVLRSSFNSFQGKATQAASGIDEISNSAMKAESSMESLEEQMAKIKVSNNNSSNNSEGETEEEYIARADAIVAKQREIRKSSLETAGTIEEYFEEADEPPGMLLQTFEMIKTSLQGVPQLAKIAGTGIKDGFASAKQETSTIGEKVDTLKDSLYALERKGLYFGDTEYDEAYSKLAKAENELKEYKKQLEGTDVQQKKVAKSGKKMNSTMNKTKKEAVPLTKNILKLSSMFELMVIRMAMRTAMESVKEGFENLARYSEDANQAISSLVSSMTMLKNSFSVAVAPLVEAFSPAISKAISQLAELNNWIGQTMAALVGKDTFTKAVAVQEDYAASLSDTQKAAKEAAEQVKKTAFEFDDLIQIQKSSTDSTDYTGPTPDQMFETQEVSNEAKVMAEDVKKTLSDLFQPMKESWEEYGTQTINAAKTMLGSLKQLASDVGASFIEVWNDEGYGKTISSDLIVTFNNLAFTVANLANRFDEAWESADTGTNIMRHLGDIVLEITGFFREASESIKNWAAELDFKPLLKAFDGLLVSIEPVISKIADLLLWLLDEMLLPLSKWAVETAIPATFDLISAAIDVLSSTIDILQPLGNWMWEEFMVPVGKWTGNTIIKAIKGITEALVSFSNWIKENKDGIIAMTEAVAVFFAAWKIAEFAAKISIMISSLGSLSKALWLLLVKLDLSKLGFLGVVAAISALITAAIEIYKNWDKMTPKEKVISMLLLAAGAAAALAVATQAVTGPAGAALTAAAIVAGIAAAAIAINAGSKSAQPSSSFSGNNRSFQTLTANTPHLATGTVVPPNAGEFAAILGDNKKDYEVVSPLGTMKQAFKEAISEMGGLGGGTVQADMVLDGTKFGQLVYKYNNKETNRVGVHMVAGG